MLLFGTLFNILIVFGRIYCRPLYIYKAEKCLFCNVLLYIDYRVSVLCSMYTIIEEYVLILINVIKTVSKTITGRIS